MAPAVYRLSIRVVTPPANAEKAKPKTPTLHGY